MQLATQRRRADIAGRAEGGEPTTMEFVVRWAKDQLATSSHTRGAGSDGLTLHDVAVVTRQVARIFGDRPLAGVTLGEIAQLPVLLEQTGLSPDVSRSACRAIGSALRVAIRQWPDGATSHH